MQNMQNTQKPKKQPTFCLNPSAQFKAEDYESLKGTQKGAHTESRMLKLLMVASVLLHITAYAVFTWGNFGSFDLTEDEWVIDVEVIGDDEGKTAIADVEKAPEAAAKQELLPQLPKTVAIDAPPADDNNVEAPPAEVPKPIAEEKPKNAPEEQKIKENPDVAVKLKLQELAKRKALDQLREQKELQKQNQAPIEDPLARVAANLDQGRVDKAVGAQKEKLYGVSLKKRISKYYTLPKTFTSPITDLQVVLALVVNREGHLVSVKIHKSSQDNTFDEYSIIAAQNAAPYDKPPPSLVGQTIHVAFRR